MKHTIFLFCFALLSSPAGASLGEPEPARRYLGARVDPGADLTLAIMCVGETGLTREGWFEGCSVQVSAIANRAARSGWTLSRMANAYSSALKSPPPARAWILELDRTGRRPPSFHNAAWERVYRPRFERLLWLVRSQLAGDVESSCPEADHFGAVHLDGHRARRAGWRRVCEDVHPRQGFWDSTQGEQSNEDIRRR